MIMGSLGWDNVALTWVRNAQIISWILNTIDLQMINKLCSFRTIK